jgi:hypothetical protein
MPAEKKRKAANDRPDDNGERKAPEFICICEDLENSTHTSAVQCRRARKEAIYYDIVKR